MSPSFFLLAFAATLAEPAAPSIDVRWTAPAGCPDGAAVASSVEVLSGAKAVSEGGADLTVTGEVTLQEAGYGLSLTLETAGTTQVRMLEAADCQVLARAAALVIVVALDPVEVAARWPEPEAEPEPEPLPEPLPEPEPLPARPKVGPLEAGVGLNVGVAGRTLPGVGAALEVAPFVGIERIHARLSAQYRTPRTETLSDNPDAGARFQLVAGGVRLCPNAMPGSGRRVRIPLCAGVDFGAVLAEPRGPAVRNGSGASSFWSAAAFEAGVAVQVARVVSITAAFEAGIALSRPSFRLEGGGQLHEVARFAPRGLLGVQVHLPR